MQSLGPKGRTAGLQKGDEYLTYTQAENEKQIQSSTSGWVSSIGATGRRGLCTAWEDQSKAATCLTEIIITQTEIIITQIINI